jgi:hypothetical protein
MPAQPSWCITQEHEHAGLPGQGSGVRHIGPRYDQQLCPGHRSQPKGHVPTIKERTFPGMGKDDDDRVHSGGLPTTTVLSTVLAATVVRSQSKKYKVQAWRVPSRAIRGKSRVAGQCHHVQLGLYPVSSTLR